MQMFYLALGEAPRMIKNTPTTTTKVIQDYEIGEGKEEDMKDKSNRNKGQEGISI